MRSFNKQNIRDYYRANSYTIFFVVITLLSEAWWLPKIMSYPRLLVLFGIGTVMFLAAMKTIFASKLRHFNYRIHCAGNQLSRHDSRVKKYLNEVVGEKSRWDDHIESIETVYLEDAIAIKMELTEATEIKPINGG